MNKRWRIVVSGSRRVGRNRWDTARRVRTFPSAWGTKKAARQSLWWRNTKPTSATTSSRRRWQHLHSYRPSSASPNYWPLKAAKRTLSRCPNSRLVPCRRPRLRPRRSTTKRTWIWRLRCPRASATTRRPTARRVARLRRVGSSTFRSPRARVSTLPLLLPPPPPHPHRRRIPSTPVWTRRIPKTSKPTSSSTRPIPKVSSTSLQQIIVLFFLFFYFFFIFFLDNCNNCTICFYFAIFSFFLFFILFLLFFFFYNCYNFFFLLFY